MGGQHDGPEEGQDRVEDQRAAEDPIGGPAAIGEAARLSTRDRATLYRHTAVTFESSQVPAGAPRSRRFFGVISAGIAWVQTR